MKHLIIGIVVIVVLLVAAVIILPFVIPADMVKERALAAAREATGREVRIDGAFELDLGLTTTVRMEGVVFGNADWGSRKELATVQSIAATVELLPLLSSKLVIPRLAVSGADVLLETNAEGRANWEFAKAGDAGTSSGAAPSDDGGAAMVPKLGELTLDNIVVAYKDGVSGAEERLSLATLGIVAKDADGPLALTLDGRWNDDPIAGDGTLPNLATLATGDGPIPMKLNVKAFDLAIAVDGRVTPQGSAPSFDLALTVKAPNLNELQPLAGGALPTAGPLDLSTGIKGNAQTVSLETLKLVFGKTELAGTVSADLSGARPRIEGKLAAKRIDLTELMPAAEADTASGGGEAAKTETAKKRVFPEDPLPLEGLKAADAKLDLTIGELITPSVSMTDVKVMLTLDGGKLDVDPFATTVAGSTVAGALALDGAAATPTLDLKLGSEAVDLGRLLNETGTTDMLEGSATLDLDVKGQGQSVAAIMASLNGHSRVLMGQGRAKTEAFDVLVGGLSQVMGTLFSEKSEWTVVECIASDFAIKDGLATSQVNAINTEHILVFAEGDVNLGQEALELKLTPKPKSTTLNVSVPIKVGGTFLQPTFAPDELATARRLGGLLGAAIFPPAALIGLADLGSSDNPCLKDIAAQSKAEPASSGSGLPNPADAVKSLTGGAEDGKSGGDVGKVLEGAGSGIKKLFGN